MKNNKTNIYFFQFNFRYGDAIFIPYSVGILWSFAKTFEVIDAHYENKGFIFNRDDPDNIVFGLDNPGIAAFSSYVWNWEMNVAVAERIKKKYPRCLIVFGGPQVPHQVEDFFDKYPFIDALVHGEGEVTFVNILKEHMKAKRYEKIEGVTCRDKAGRVSVFQRREPISDLDSIPSPYLSGVFDNLLKLPYTFQIIWETNRGCPYDCTYCDWGSSATKKVRMYREDRLRKEIEWFAKHKLDFIFGTDGNFGIFSRDVDLAKKLAETKRKTGFPQKYRVSYAKDSTERVLRIAEILNLEGLDKGISLSVQSMNPDTLNAIRRRNLKIGPLSKFVHEYVRKGIPTFTEIILGLPEETYASFKKGIDELFDAGVHDSLVIYNCTALPNSMLNSREYLKKYGIVTIKTPIFLNHSVPSDDITEYEQIVVGTTTMPVSDWKRQYYFAWIIQACHALNLTQVIAIYFRDKKGVPYSVFYEELLSFAEKNPATIIGKELSFTKEKLERAFKGESWGTVLEPFSNIVWSAEEASYLRISENFDGFYSEMGTFLRYLLDKLQLNLDSILLDEILAYQKGLVVKWDRDGSNQIYESYPFHTFHKAKRVGERVDLMKGRYLLKIIDDLNFGGDKRRYAQEVLWYGRKGGKFMYSQIEEIRLD